MIVFRKLLIVGLILVPLLIPRIVLGDPSWLNELEVQGAHVVSEGAYFRFLVVNHYPIPIYVSVLNDSEPIYVLPSPSPSYLNVNITESIYILPNSSANYDVIAPEVSFPYKKVTYTIIQALDKPISENWVYIMKYQVTVLDSNYFDFIVLTNILFAIGLIVVAIAFIIWQRKLRRSAKRSQEACPQLPYSPSLLSYFNSYDLWKNLCTY